MKDKLEVRMIDFNQVKESALITFISEKGYPTSIWIKKDTFRDLITGNWNSNEYGNPHLHQIGLKHAMKDIKDPMDWFENMSNNISKSRVQGITNG